MAKKYTGPIQGEISPEMFYGAFTAFILGLVMVLCFFLAIAGAGQ